MSQDLTIIDGDKKYFFSIAPRVDEGSGMGKLYLIQTRDWEPADGSVPWRTAMHPFSAGLGPNRINPSFTLAGEMKNRPGMVYAKGNLDASYSGFITFPPAYEILESVVLPFSSAFDAEELYYGGAAYGTIPYMGAAAGIADIAIAVRNFNGKAYFAGGQYLFSIDSTLTLSLVKDFGVGKTIYDIEPFNDELVIAMGETEKIWTMSTSEVFTQAVNNTYAIALGRTNELLWRADTVNEISNCITAPRTLTSWVPTAGSKYSAGDKTYSITDLVEYGGSIVAIKPDGVYLADSNTDFHNQTPQLLIYPDADNGKRTFTAWGFLWIPTIIGLIRMAVGEAPVVGPELSQRPDFRFHVHAGVEWDGAIYLLCADHGGTEELFICKMTRDREGVTSNPYIYHEWRRLGDAHHANVLVIYTGATNPVLCAGIEEDLALVVMGRGSGPNIDDANYEYGTTMEVESGLMVASTDLGIEIDLVGVKVVGKQIDGGTLTIEHDMDGKNVWTPLQSTVDGAGKVTITDEGWFTATRYAQPNTKGRALYLKLSGTMPEGQLGRDRTEVYEVWAFGNAHPDSTEIISVDIYSDTKARVRGIIQGRKYNNFRMLKDLANSGKTFQIVIPGYDEDQIVRVQIQEITESNVSVRRDGVSDIPSNVTRIVFRRIDFSGDLNG